MVQLFCDRVENIVGKVENAGNKHFLLFPHLFKTLLCLCCKTLGLFGKELKKIIAKDDLTKSVDVGMGYTI